MIAIIQHVPHESPGWIINWLEGNDKSFRLVDIYRGDPLPPAREIEGLVIMGGSMNVYEEALYPWLAEEKRYIRNFIHEGKKVLGICLGAQLVAASLGARVKRNAALEIGWFPIEIHEDELPAKMQGVFPLHLLTFHWHGDTFEVPEGGAPFASSEACPNQGFAFGEHVLAIQFHPEMTESGIEDLIAHDAEDLLSESVFVQTAEEMRKGITNIEHNKEVLFKLLNSFFRT